MTLAHGLSHGRAKTGMSCRIGGLARQRSQNRL